jgi:hypothetical protein
VAILYHSALHPSSAWYAKQTGTGGKCGAPQVEAFKSELRRHEGATGAANSHVGIWLAALNNSLYTFKSAFEKLVTTNNDNFEFRRDELWSAVNTATQVATANLDNADIPKLLNDAETAGSCVFAF